MDAAYISGMSALAGSVFGGLTTWLSQWSQARAGMRSGPAGASGVRDAMRTLPFRL